MKSPWKKVIVHVDMDAFFAAVEQLLRPELRGKPVIVGADPKGGKGRGVVSTASYEARVYGVHSAMPISRAFRLCPQGIYLYPNGKLYKQYSQQVFEILARFTPLIQVVSIDEAFLDVTGSVHLYGDIRKLGEEIKRQIFTETGLTASVGIAPSKSVAKIASDMEKPDGLTIVEPEAVQSFLDPLPVTKLWGVGKKTFQTLVKLGIQTVEQLRGYPQNLLKEKFGKMGGHLYRMARGIDEREVHDRDEIKSVSHETTFDIDQTDPELLISTLLSLAEKVSSRLRKYGLRGRTVQIKLRFEDFSTFTRHKTLSYHTNLTDEIFTVSKNLYEQFKDKDKPVRLIGVGVSQLTPESGMQTSFWDMDNERKVRLEKVMDQLQEKFGNSALTHANTLTAKKRKEKKK
jgi:nucleotidyltransferase/DNA polymerase involved in DNA repair